MDNKLNTYGQQNGFKSNRKQKGIISLGWLYLEIAISGFRFCLINLGWIYTGCLGVSHSSVNILEIVIQKDCAVFRRGGVDIAVCCVIKEKCLYLAIEVFESRPIRFAQYHCLRIQIRHFFEHERGQITFHVSVILPRKWL